MREIEFDENINFLINFLIFQLKNDVKFIYNDIVNFEVLKKARKYFNKNKEFNIKIIECRDINNIEELKMEYNCYYETLIFNSCYNKVFRVCDLSDKRYNFYYIDIFIDTNNNKILIQNEIYEEDLNFGNLFKNYINYFNIKNKLDNIKNKEFKKLII